MKLSGVTDEFHQCFEEEMLPIVYNGFQKNETEGALPKSLRSELPHTPVRLTTRKKTKNSDTPEHRCRNSPKTVSKSYQT